MNVKSPNNISKWQMEFNSAFKGLMRFSNDVEQEVYGLNYLENSVFVITH
jgi:hypothetical protein